MSLLCLNRILARPSDDARVTLVPHITIDITSWAVIARVCPSVDR